MKPLCLRCKGKLWCGLSYCPLQVQMNKFNERNAVISVDKTVFGASPGVFIGWNNYPNVFAGVLTPPFEEEGTEVYEQPDLWAKSEYAIPEVLRLRTGLINSREQHKVSSAKFGDAFVDKLAEVALSAVPVDTEIRYRKLPQFDVSFDNFTAPMGPAGDVEKLNVTENPVIPRRVDYVTSDTDMKSVDGIWDLYQHGLDNYYLTRILSAGQLGMALNRKLVPTRWSITALDDTLGKKLIDEVKGLPVVNKPSLHFYSYLDNSFCVLLLPRAWSYELLEMYSPLTRTLAGRLGETTIMTDSEGNTGRKGYATETAGGYYASRLAVLEGLKTMGRQALAVVFRTIGPDYWASLGVWVVRETVRKAMGNKVMESDNLDEIFERMSRLLGFEKGFFKEKSRFIQYSREQKSLLEFL